MSNSRIILEFLGDVFVALVLLIAACAFAGSMDLLIPLDFLNLSVFWFMLGLIPVAIYARWRGVVNFDRWDIVALLPFPVVWALIPERMLGQLLDIPFAFAQILVGALVISYVFRRFLPSNRNAG